MSEQVLSEIRTELLAIRTRVDHILEKLAGLGAGFGPVPGSDQAPQDRWDEAVGRVRDVLPGDLLPKLSVVRQGPGLITVTATWLGTDAWHQVDRKVKQMGGRWIRDGKASRWEVSVP